MHKKKIIKAMHEKAWTEREINKALKFLKKAEEAEPKGLSLFHYWTNIFFLIVIIVVTSVSLLPIITLNNEAFSTILIIIMGLIFGTLSSHSILTLEDYNSKHHRIWGNVILFFVLLMISYASLKTAFYAVGIGASAFKYALTYKISFAIFPAIITAKHEVWLNKFLKEVEEKIDKK